MKSAQADPRPATAPVEPRAAAPSGSLARGLAVFTLLAEEPNGIALGKIASALGIPKAAAYRSLSELTEFGFVQQSGPQGSYSLSLRFVSLALRFLGQSTLVDVAKPAMQRLATASEELVRLCLVEDGTLYWVDKRQGARTGLRFDDPDMGAEVRLSKSATGIAWLAALPQDRALELVAEQDARWDDEPATRAEVLERIEFAREHGFAYTESTYEVGLAGMAVPVIPSIGGAPVALLSIAGPSIRFTLEKAFELAPMLQGEAEQLAHLASSV